MAVQDEVAYIALKEERDHCLLYACMQHDATTDVFNDALRRKLELPKSKKHASDTNKKSALRAYLSRVVPPIAEQLHLTMVTDLRTDHLLTVKEENEWFVYFGAMTKTLIHVACWLQIPLDEHIQCVVSESPKIFFWVLHTSYAQELEALGDVKTGLTMAAVRKVLDLTEGIEYQ